MDRFAALLLGASDYDLAGFTPLPFVPRDLERLGEALRARGFRVVLPPTRGQVSANFVNGEVGHFLRTARRGETVLICLSGHGLHAEGKDYLIPEDLHSGVEPPWSGCVAIDWKYEVERTPAAQVLFLIDACRNGVRQDFMSGTIGWATGEALVVAGRKVAHLYACSPGEYARFVGSENSRQDPGSGSFSLFSRAVLDVLRAHDGPLNLEQLRVDAQARIQEFHERYGKRGRAQNVRVLTDVDQAGFLVAGPARYEAVPPVPDAVAGPAPVLQPLAADLTAAPPADPGELLGLAVYELQTTGRTAYLEECAAVGPVDDLLRLCSLQLAPAATAAMWTAAALRRPVVSLVELVAALRGAGLTEAAHQVLESAATGRPPDELLRALGAAGLRAETVAELREMLLRALDGLPLAELVACVVALKQAGLDAEAEWFFAVPRPAEDLPPLLAALDAADLAAEAGQLLRVSVTGYGPQAVDGLAAALAHAGQSAHRVTVLTLLATGPVDDFVTWLATGRSRDGFDEDAAFALRTAVARSGDRDALPAALREAGLRGAATLRHLDTVHEEFARLAPADLLAVLGTWTDRGETADAEAVVTRAVRPFEPDRAAELGVLLHDGPAALLDPLCRELSAAPPAQVAEFCGHVGVVHGLRDTVLSSLGQRLPPDGFLPFLEELHRRGLHAAAAGFQGALARHRQTTDLLPTLARMREPDRSRFLSYILVPPRSSAQLAELLQLVCREEWREAVGDPMAAAIVFRSNDDVLTAILGELHEKGRSFEEEALLRHLAVGVGTDRPERIAQWLASTGRRDRAAALLAQAAEGRSPTELALLCANMVASAHSELGRRLLADAAEQRSMRYLAELAAALAHYPADPGPAAEAAQLLQRVVERRPPGQVAELLVTLDSRWPDDRVPVDIGALLDAFLQARSVGETGLLLQELAAWCAVGDPGERLAASVRTRAPALFHAARTTGAPTGTQYVLNAFRGDPPVRVDDVRQVFDEMARTGGFEERAAVLDRLGRLQPPEAVAGLLKGFPQGGVLESLCRAVAERPQEVVVAVLAELGRLEGAERGLAEYLGRTVPPDPCRNLLVELLAARQGRAASIVLGAAPWSAAPAELAELFLLLEREGDGRRRAALETLTLNPLSAAQAMELLHHLHRDGPREAVLRAVAPTPDAPSLWLDLNARGWFRHAAILLGQLPADTDVVPWYRRLPEISDADRAALLRESGADGPLREIAADAGVARAALITAVLHRPPADVASLLAAPTGAAARWTEPRRVLAAARRSAELVSILEKLAGRHPDEAGLITDRLVADEPVGRIAELLGGGPVAAGLTARSALARGVTTGLVGRLLRAGHDEGAEELIDATVIPASDAAGAARVVVGLAGAGVSSSLRQRLIHGFCRRHQSQANALLTHLVRAGLTADVEETLTVFYVVRTAGERDAIMRKLRAAATAEEAKAPARWRPWRKDTNGP
ncbi:hypothetical protein GCM10009639_02320 [Kitasatospora putterlickiae]|uniref:Caspase domain-containing protein n=1 Tax=Kitasatospora putterlickiae TaxID=221725 RepID=A0ABP4I9Y6_9ACTN